MSPVLLFRKKEVLSIPMMLYSGKLPTYGVVLLSSLLHVHTVFQGFIHWGVGEGEGEASPQTGAKQSNRDMDGKQTHRAVHIPRPP